MDNGCKLFNKSKTVLIFIVITLSLIQCTRNTNIIRDDMVINGLTLCNSYTKEQMIEALGQPDSISVFTSEAGVINKYYYGNDFFTVIEEGQLFVDFTVTNPRFKFNNFISIGDPVARVTLLGGTIEEREVIDPKGVLWKYKLWHIPKELNADKHYSLSTLFYYNDEGKIIEIATIFNSWF